MRLESLIQAAEDNANGQGLPPVESWHPENCTSGKFSILKNGTWLHEGKPIARQSMIKLFSTILRKDEDGRTWLVTPVEKVEVEVEAAPFMAISVEQQNGDLYFTTNMDTIVRADAAHPISVSTDPVTQEPQPFVLVRGRLQAMLTRPVFYQLVEWAKEQDGQLGIISGDLFFALGLKGAHLVD